MGISLFYLQRKRALAILLMILTVYLMMFILITNTLYNNSFYYSYSSNGLVHSTVGCNPLTPQIRLNNYPHTFTFVNKKPIQRVCDVLLDKSWKFISTDLQSTSDLSYIDLIFTHPTAYYASNTQKILASLSNAGQQYINAIDHIYDVTGNKYIQRTILSQYTTQFGCDLDSLHIMPVTYLLSDYNQCKAFYKYSNNNRNTSWIVKPYRGEGGNGITIYPDIKLSKGINCKTNYLAQQYINPLLIEGRKFDIRAYFLIALTDPFLVFYHPGYLRLAMSKYIMNTDAGTHLTNTHVQSKQKNYNPSQHMWTFLEFQEYLNKYSIASSDFVTRVVEVFIKRISLLLFNSGKHLLPRRQGSFQLVGIDCLIDNNLKPWFTEANNYPLFINSPLDVRNLSTNVAKGMLELVFLLNEHPPAHILLPGYKYENWELVYNEQIANCKRKLHKPFNPCV